MDVHRSYILSLWLSFHLLTVSECTVKTVYGFVGEKVVLPCRYDISYHGELYSCWGRGEVPTYGCDKEIITSDGSNVTMRASPRYQFLGRLRDGDVSLTILDAQEHDTGIYGCRVHIKGLFNDQKETVNLIIAQAPVPTANAPESPINATEQARATHKHTRGHEGTNSTGSSDVSIPQNSEGDQPPMQSTQLAVLLPVFLLLLLALIIVFLLFMRKRWKKASEMLGISQQPTNGVLYSNSDSSLGLHSREMAVENIYQMDEGDDY